MIRDYAKFIEGDKPYLLSPQSSPKKSCMVVPMENECLITRVSESAEAPLTLERAVEIGDKEAIKSIVTRKTRIDKKNKEGRTPLEIALDNRDTGALKLLVEEGRLSKKKLPLHSAIKKSRIDHFMMLIKFDVFLNSVDSDGDTALHIAAGRGKKNFVLQLYRVGARIDPVNKLGETPLAVAIRNTHVHVVKTLLEYGSNGSYADQAGYTPALLAKMEGSHFFKQIKASLYKSPFTKALLKEQYYRMLLCHSFYLKENASLISKGGELMRGNEGGFDGDYIAIEMQKSIKAFCEQEGSGLEENLKGFLEGIGTALCSRTAKEMYADWMAGKPIIIDTGFEEHYVSVCVWKDKFTLVNRGEDDPRNKDHIFVGTFNEELFSVKFIESISELKSKELKDFGLITQMST